MSQVGDGLIPILAGVAALTLIIAWHYRSVRAIVGVSLVAALLAMGTFEIFSADASDLPLLIGLLVPGFLIATTFGIGAFQFAKSGRHITSALTLVALLNCGWLVVLDWQFAKVELSMKPFTDNLLKKNCPKKQANAEASSQYTCG